MCDPVKSGLEGDRDMDWLSPKLEEERSIGNHPVMPTEHKLLSKEIDWQKAYYYHVKMQ